MPIARQIHMGCRRGWFGVERKRFGRSWRDALPGMSTPRVARPRDLDRRRRNADSGRLHSESALREGSGSLLPRRRQTLSTLAVFHPKDGGDAVADVALPFHGRMPDAAAILSWKLKRSRTLLHGNPPPGGTNPPEEWAPERNPCEPWRTESREPRHHVPDGSCRSPFVSAPRRACVSSSLPIRSSRAAVPAIFAK